MAHGSSDRSAKRSRPLRKPAEVSVFPSFEEIAARAHHLFILDGRRDDTIADCWRRAENELLMRAALRIKR
jgi:hypothetical protein